MMFRSNWGRIVASGAGAALVAVVAASGTAAAPPAAQPDSLSRVMQENWTTPRPCCGPSLWRTTRRWSVTPRRWAR